MIRAKIDAAIEETEGRNQRMCESIAQVTERLIANPMGLSRQRFLDRMTETLVQRENALSCLRTVQEDMVLCPDREEALDWLFASLKLLGVSL